MREAAERLVRENRATIAVVVPVVGVVGFVLAGTAESPLLDALVASPPVVVGANVAMALPLAVGLWPLVDRRAAAGLVALAGFAYAVEAVGVLTGLPYGEFAYRSGLEPLLFGLVPVALPLFWLPVLVNGYLLAVRFVHPRLGRAATAVAAVGFVVALDVVLDPGAVAFGFWRWADPGGFYGVPLVNFAGWVVSGGVGVLVLLATLPPARVAARVAAFEPIFDTLLAFLVFWGLANVVAGQWLPALVAVALAGGLVATEPRRDGAPERA